eukprot:277810_1
MTLHGICLDKIRFDATFFKKQHKLTWKNVSSAIKHELYSEISSAIMVIVNKETYENVSSQNANNMLSALKQYRNIHANERKYISNLIKRAEYFDPKQPSTYYKYYSSVQQYTFLDNTHFWTHLSNGNELIFCNQYFMNEEYDSDAFLEDVKAQNLVHESNVCIEIGKITADAWKFISWIAQHATFLYQIVSGNEMVSNVNLVNVYYSQYSNLVTESFLPKHTLSETFLNYTTDCMSNQQIKLYTEYLQDEEYDSDAIMDDIRPLNLSTSNILKAVKTNEFATLLIDYVHAVSFRLWDHLKISGKRRAQSRFTTFWDVYNVHNCFLFSNYKFTNYEEPIFRDNVKSKAHLSFIPKTISTVNLYPQYIIDDDMYSTWCFFSNMSLIVDNIRNDVKKQFTLHAFVIPTCIVSIYDGTIQYPLQFQSN